MDLSVWWDSLSSLEKIHWIIAVPSTLIFIIQLIISLVAVDTDMDGGENYDGDFDGDHGNGMNIFSVKSILSFLMFYGWGGLAAMEKGMKVWWGISGISFIIGLIMMLFTAWVFFMLLKLQQSGTLKMENAIGKEAEVYLTIPAKKNGNGKVQIILQNGYKTLDAMTEDTEDIKTGSFVEVIDVINDILIVKRKR